MAALQELQLAVDELSLFGLPNEILMHVLDSLPTPSLLQTRSVCHRFQNLIIRIIRRRLLRAASLTDRKVILECYHPSVKFTEPYLYCDYIGTPGLSDKIEGEGSIFEIADPQPAKESSLLRLYSHFRPSRKDPDLRTYRLPANGNLPETGASEVANRAQEPFERSTVTQKVSLEAHERFTQLCFLVAVVQTGPRRHFFVSVENLIDKTQRVFRDWLAEKAASSRVANELGHENDRILWIDQTKIVGLKVLVRERKGRKDLPILFHEDEDQAISYSLDLEELIVSTTHLMLAIERQLLETGGEGNGQAMIFGNFAIPDAQQTEETTGITV